MVYKSMLIALLGLFLTGCAVYGGHGHYGYDRYYSTDHHYIERYPVHVAPRIYYRDGYRYDGRRYYDGGHRYDGKRGHDGRRERHRAPRDYQPNRRHQQRFDRGRQDHRSGQPRQDWQGRRDQAQPPRWARSDDRREVAQRRPDHRAGQPRQFQRHSQGSRANDRRDWQHRLN